MRALQDRDDDNNVCWCYAHPGSIADAPGVLLLLVVRR
jgi:hypothetical protein